MTFITAVISGDSKRYEYSKNPLESSPFCSIEEMNFRREENESISVHASDPLLETERKKIVVKYKCPFCRHVRAVREEQHAEHGQLLCPKCATRATR